MLSAATAVSAERTRPGQGGVGHQHRQRRDPPRTRPRHEKPLYWWLLTSRRWLPPRPINVYVVEHANGLVLFDTGQDRASVTDPSYFPGGLHRRRLRPAGQVPHRRARDARRPAGAPSATRPPTSTPRSSPTCTRTTSAGSPSCAAPTCWSPRRSGRSCPSSRPRPAASSARTSTSRRAVEPHQLRTDQRPGPGAVHRVARRHGRRLARPAPDARSHARLALAARPPPDTAAAAAGRRPHLRADLLERRQLPGVGDRSQLANTTDKVLALAERMPGLVVLPAHDPTAAQRLLDS